MQLKSQLNKPQINCEVSFSPVLMAILASPPPSAPTTTTYIWILLVWINVRTYFRGATASTTVLR